MYAMDTFKHDSEHTINWLKVLECIIIHSNRCARVEMVWIAYL